MSANKVVSRGEWLEARKEHLNREKEFTRLRDQLSRERRELPWELVEAEYTFEGERGMRTLSEVFDGRSQLVVYHAMFDPATAGPATTWTAEAACFFCSYWLDNIDGVTVHLNHRDITMVAVSRAPYPAIASYRERMGWTFPWLSSGGSHFNFDYGVSFTEEELASGQVDYNYRLNPAHASEQHGISVFLKDGEGRVFHTYSTYARGVDMLNVAYHYMDLVPHGRAEDGQGPLWVHRHDEYPDE